MIQQYFTATKNNPATLQRVHQEPGRSPVFVHQSYVNIIVRHNI